MGKLAIITLGILCALGAVLGSAYVRYGRRIDQKLSAGAFADTSNVYAAPQLLIPGQSLTRADVAALLRRAGYGDGRPGRSGTFLLRDSNAIDIFPARMAHEKETPEPARIQCDARKITRIVSLRTSRALPSFQVRPRLLANISANRERRRLVRFAEIPSVLVNAVLAAEDKRFFEHSGFDTLRMLKAAYVDFRQGRKRQGASTITMQLARSLWLDPAKNWRRKFAEMLITEHLEHKLSKQQIFEDYANEIYLGRHGTYSIHGFGEAAEEYFGKDIRQLTLPEAATLAGLIQRPGYLNPFRFPERARERRNVVLERMRQDGFITPQEFRAAASASLDLGPRTPRPSAAPYFMDLLSNELQSRFQDRDLQAHEVYTTLDPDLQRDAFEAVQAGLKKATAALSRLNRRNGARAEAPAPQVALVALDPHSGEVRALVGGANYAASQLNRALALRQPGSTFKPFVYAAALNTGLTGGKEVFTPASVIDDQPTTFFYKDEAYQPTDFRGDFAGEVTLRQALIRSVNVASVNVAQAIGYGAVARLAQQAGLDGVHATPAAALGAYEVSPLALAAAYTVFSNQGTYVKPWLIDQVRDREGRVVYLHQPEQRPVLDPRVDYLVVNMLEDVLNRGTGASARAQGFSAPAAGKTGTSHDGWFAGFTSELLCVVWVGYDDGRDLGLEGSRSALPIWTEFMKRAGRLPRYASPKPFKPPKGIVTAEIDPESGLLATPDCLNAREEYFLEGTAPTEYCSLHTELPAILTGGAALAPETH